MDVTPDHAVYLIRRFSRDGDKPKKYRMTFEVSDEYSGQVMATNQTLPPQPLELKVLVGIAMAVAIGLGGQCRCMPVLTQRKP